MAESFTMAEIKKAFDVWALKWCIAEDTWPEAWHDFFANLTDDKQENK